MIVLAEKFFAHTLLFSVEAIVFALLALLLLAYYRGLGRKYVKYWMLSLSFLSLNHIIMTAQAMLVEVSILEFEQVLLAVLWQVSIYFHLLALLFGLFSATSKKKLARKTVLTTFVVSAIIGIIATLLYSTDQNAVFNRYYLRETLPAFFMGGGLLAAGLYLYNSSITFFASRIFTIFCFVMGIRFTLFSFFSIVVLTEDWFQSLTEVLIYFDMGADIILAFTMLIWMQGAERKSALMAIDKAQYLGKHDRLTGALNREQVMEKLPLVIRETAKNNQTLGIFLLDIKRFKFVNDTYGLKTGDLILGEIASRLHQSLLLPKVVGRLSGDSFAFVVDITEESQEAIATEHLHGLIARPYNVNNQHVLLQCSVGYCTYPENGELAEDLLQKANLALAQAESKNIASVKYQSGMQSQGRELLSREKELRKALSNNEFVLHFQPQLNLLTNRLEGVEALVRWQHPEKGLLAPNAFFGDIEALNLLSVLDNYVLKKCCESLARWYKEFNRRITVAINLTAVEFQDPKLVSKVQALLFEYDIPPTCIEFEITENVVITDIETAMDTIVVLQSMGIKVSIDDFGTGYSSLAYLRELPIDKIKIDRSFIHEVASNDSDLTIVKSMIELSHGLGKRVLAEGVETEEQLRLLRNLGCDTVQGFFVSKPLPEEKLTKFLKRK